MKKSVSILEGIILFLMVVSFVFGLFIGKDEGYRSGQIDALRGNIKYQFKEYKIWGRIDK
jgi:ABC-type microcin C transport system permease subunit YejE